MIEDDDTPEPGSPEAVIEEGIKMIAAGLFMLYKRSPVEAEFEVACLAHYFTDMHHDAVRESIPMNTTVH